MSKHTIVDIMSVDLPTHENKDHVDVYDRTKMRRIVIDISDLVFWLRNHKTISGIQRLELELIRYSLRHFVSSDVVYCMTDGLECLSYWQISADDLEALLHNIDNSGNFSLDKWKIYISKTFNPEKLSEIVVGKSDVLFIVGAFWVHERIVYLIDRMRMNGARIVTCIYDLIPVYQPEFVPKSLAKYFSIMLSQMLSMTDAILTISKFTESQVSQFYRETGRAPVPITAVPLAQALADTPSFSLPQAAPWRLATLMRDPYVLCVGTIEVRKNHSYLFRIWRELLRKYDPRSIPRLVWLGREGWQVGDLMSQLDNTDNLDGHIVLLHGLSDLELKQLYQSCLFTVFPSLSEGWGLPVGESLHYGKVCVASGSTSIPEVGGEHAIYCDPYDIGDGLEKIEALIFDDARRMQLESAIHKTRLRNWNDVGRDYFAHLFSPLPAAGPSPGAVPSHPIPYAKRVKVIDLAADVTGVNLARQLSSPPLNMHLVDGWHRVSELGQVWGVGNRPIVRFSIPSQLDWTVADDFRIYLELTLAPWQIPNKLWVISTGKEEQAVICDCDKLSIVIPSRGKLLENRVEFELTFVLADFHPPAPPETRPLGIGIRSLGIVRSNDVVSRIALYEQWLT